MHDADVMMAYMTYKEIVLMAHISHLRHDVCPNTSGKGILREVQFRLNLFNKYWFVGMSRKATIEQWRCWKHIVSTCVLGIHSLIICASPTILGKIPFFSFRIAGGVFWGWSVNPVNLRFDTAMVIFF